MAKKNAKYWHRTLHRDIAYFYVGLIIAFSISGIALNHRQTFDSQKYTVKTDSIHLAIPSEQSLITDEYLKKATNSFIKNEFRGFRIRKENIRVYFKDAFTNINLQTGKGEIEYLKTIPILEQMILLHKTTRYGFQIYLVLQCL